MTDQAELLKRALALCELQDDELNEAQAEFVDRATRKLEAGRALNDLQARAINMLWEKWCDR